MQNLDSRPAFSLAPFRHLYIFCYLISINISRFFRADMHLFYVYEFVGYISTVSFIFLPEWYGSVCSTLTPSRSTETRTTALTTVLLQKKNKRIHPSVPHKYVYIYMKESYSLRKTWKYLLKLNRQNINRSKASETIPLDI